MRDPVHRDSSVEPLELDGRHRLDGHGVADALRGRFIDEDFHRAREIAGATHHFRVVQLPVSLAMPEAARALTQPLGRKMVTLLEAAEALGVGVVASAPLMQGRLASGLPAELRELFPGCTTDAQRALRFATSLPGVTAALAGMRRPAHVMENSDAWRASV